jgi:hypothetical protein
MKRWLMASLLTAFLSGFALAGCGMDYGPEDESDEGGLEGSYDEAALDDESGEGSEEGLHESDKADNGSDEGGEWVPVGSSNQKKIDEERASCTGKADGHCGIPNSGTMGHGDPVPWKEGESEYDK